MRALLIAASVIVGVYVGGALGLAFGELIAPALRKQDPEEMAIAFLILFVILPVFSAGGGAAGGFGVAFLTRKRPPRLPGAMHSKYSASALPYAQSGLRGCPEIKSDTATEPHHR